MMDLTSKQNFVTNQNYRDQYPLAVFSFAGEDDIVVLLLKPPHGVTHETMRVTDTVLVYHNHLSISRWPRFFSLRQSLQTF